MEQLRSKSVRRVRSALLLTQVAILIWLIDETYSLIAEFFMHFFGMTLPGGWYRWLTFIAAIVVHGLALTAIFKLTRRASSRVAFAGGAIIFNVLLHQCLFLGLATVNTISQMTSGEKLVVGNPLVCRLPQWSIEWIWLVMIFSGYAVLRDVNARHAAQLFSRRQLRMLLFTALAGWTFWTVNDWYVYDFLEYLIPYEGDLSEFIWKSTVFSLIIFGPTGVFCVTALFAAATARKRLRDSAQGLCLKCGYDLRGTNSDICPECGA